MTHLRSADGEPVRPSTVSSTLKVIASILPLFFPFSQSDGVRVTVRFQSGLSSKPSHRYFSSLQKPLIPHSPFSPICSSPSHLLCLSTLPSLPFSPLPPPLLSLLLSLPLFVKGSFISRPEWCRSTGSSDNGPIIRGKQSPWKRNKDSEPSRGPTLHLSPQQQQPPLAVHAVWVCAHVFVCVHEHEYVCFLGGKRVCSCLYKQAGAGPWDFCITDLPPQKRLGSQPSFLNRLHSTAGTMHLLLLKSIFLHDLLCILICVSAQNDLADTHFPVFQHNMTIPAPVVNMHVHLLSPQGNKRRVCAEKVVCVSRV